jgi:hypothetical protein
MGEYLCRHLNMQKCPEDFCPYWDSDYDNCSLALEVQERRQFWQSAIITTDLVTAALERKEKALKQSVIEKLKQKLKEREGNHTVQ